MSIITSPVLLISIPVMLFIYPLSFYLYYKWLKNSPKEFWLILFANVLLGFGFSTVSTIFVRFLSDDIFHTTDVTKLGIYSSVFFGLITLSGIILSPVCDIKGIKQSLKLGTILIITGLLFMSFINNVFFVTLFGFIPFILGTAILFPVFNVAIKRFTNKENITLGFGIFGITAAVGSTLASELYETLYSFSDSIFPIFGFITVSKLAFLISSIFVAPALVLTSFINTDIKENERLFSSIFFRQFAGKIKKQFLKVLSSNIFWKFILIIAVLTFIRMMFFHFNYTLPKYTFRIFGDQIKANKMMLINSMVIGLLVPFIPAFTRRIRSYKMIMIGTGISAISIFLIFLPPQIWSEITNSQIGKFLFSEILNTSARIPEVTGFLVFLIVFSIGEAIWSPRVSQFIVETAPKGQESTYLGLSAIPFFITKFLLGPVSGLLMNSYVPLDEFKMPYDHYPDRNFLWMWIGIISILTPVGLILFRKLQKN